MTEHRRNPGPTSRYSDERRSTVGGGTIPIEWQAQTIDLDALLVEIDGAPYLVGVADRLFVNWDKVPFRILGLVEAKNPGENRGAYVTFALARMAGIPAYRVTLHDDHLVSERSDGEERVFSSVREFVYATHVLRRSA